MMLSGVSGEGRTEALRTLAKIVSAARVGEPVDESKDDAEDEAPRGDWTP